MINNNDDNENINQDNQEDINEINTKQDNNNINNNNSQMKSEEKIEKNNDSSIRKENSLLNKEEKEKERNNKNYKIRSKTSIRKRYLKIKVSFRKIFPKAKLTREEVSEKHRKENKISENDLEGSQESSVFIKKGGRYLINDTKKILLISQSQKKYDSKNDKSKNNSKLKNKNNKNKSINNKSINNKNKENIKNNIIDDDEYDEKEENEESDLSENNDKEIKTGGKLKIKKKTELEKMRTGIELILKKGKRGKNTKDKDEEEKRRQRRKEREEKEKEKIKEDEKNKIKEKIRKQREDRIKKNKSEIKEKNKDKKYNKNNSNNILKNKNDINNINNNINSTSNTSLNKYKNNNRNKSHKIIRSRKLQGKDIRIIYNNENENENENEFDINNNNINLLRTQKLKPHLNKNTQPTFESIKSTLDTQNASNKYKTIFSEDQKNDLLNDLDIKKRKKYLKRKYKANINIFSDPLNPYLTNWPKSFLKLGFNAGIWANKNIDGVPILRIQKLRPKLEFPPIYKIKYNQFSKMKNNETSDDEENDFNNKKIYNNKYYFTQTKFKKNKNIIDKEQSLDKKYMNIDENNRTINVSKNI